MKLTTKGRYAIIAMADLVLHSRTAPVSLREITKRQSISLSYLEQLFSKLKVRKNITKKRYRIRMYEYK